MSKVNKCKVINKHGNYQFFMRSIKGQNLNDREVFVINGRELDGMIPVEVIKKGATFELIYNLTGLITLKEYLINPLNRESFGRVLQNILEVFRGMQNLFFNQDCLLLDLERVMINTATQRLNFIYIPIQGYHSGGSLRNFLLEIIRVGAFMPTEDSGYVTEYIRILNKGLNFSIFELEEYINGLMTEGGYQAQKSIKCHKCSTDVEIGTNFCPVCGAKIAKSAEQSTTKGIYDPLAEAAKPASVQTPGHATEAKVQPYSGGLGTQEFSDVADQYEDIGTSVLGLDSLEQAPMGYLKRVKNGEKIRITGSVFYVGRSNRECDYAINDNTAISKKHIKIRTSGKQFYVEDLGATNKTYVNDREIHKEVELCSGMKIRLANEEFEFRVE